MLRPQSRQWQTKRARTEENVTTVVDELVLSQLDQPQTAA